MATDYSTLRMYYQGDMISPIPQISYSTELMYMNDVAAGHKYTITLQGKMFGNDFASGSTADALAYLNNIFSSNGHLLEINETYEKGGMFPIFLANNIIVRKIDFKESKNNWTKYIEYSVELESTDVLFGKDLQQYYQAMAQGQAYVMTEQNMESTTMNDIDAYRIKSWDEQFTMDMGESQTQSTVVAEKRLDYENEDASQVPISIVTSLGGEHFSINYTVNAVGDQRMGKLNGAGRDTLALPAWEHAKRFVHRKLLDQMGGLFSSFLSMNGFVNREIIGWPTAGNGLFANIEDYHSQGVYNLPSYGLYNEHISFDVSESDGSFSATYNAIVKKHCPTELSDNPNDFSDEWIVGCSDGVLHTLTKSVEKTYEANQYPTVANIKHTITVNGEITGLVPGGILGPGSRIKVNNLPTGSFLTYNVDVAHPITGDLGGVDKWAYASLAFDKIFDYNKYDFKKEFKDAIGITPYAIGVSPTANVIPHSLTITRNMIEGKVSYTATYGTALNCDPNNFQIDISTNESVPVIAEFTVPNNNLRDANGKICETGRGYGVVQLLGTSTPKTIDVSISASVIQNWNKCCFGSVVNDGSEPEEGVFNLLNWDFMQLQEFIIPSGMNIPYISDNYALTKRTKTVKYPQGDMSISLSYVCADLCEIDDYFSEMSTELSEREPVQGFQN